MLQARIISTGVFLPTKVLSNADLEKMVETTDEWISTRTGMKERRIAEEGQFTSDMGLAAAREALAKSGLQATDIELIILATITPDYVFPCTAALIQDQLGASRAGALDIQVACSGFVYGLAMAKAFIEAKIYKNILVIAAEKLSSIVDYKDRNTCVLFGDGAGAAVVSDRGEGLFIREICLGADGAQADLLKLPAGGCRKPSTQKTVEDKLHYLQMAGKEVFKHAVRRMEEAIRTCLEKVKLSPDEIKAFIVHQANMRIIEAIAKRFEIPEEKVFKTIHKYGNTSASSVIIALHEFLAEKSLKANDNLLMVSFGSGFTWGASLLTKIGK